MPPVSFTVRPPKAAGWSAPSQRMFQDDSDGEEEFGAAGASSSRRPREERIDGFANGKQVGTAKEKPLVIAPLPNKDWRAGDWRAGARGAPSYRPEVKREEELVTHERVGDEPQRRGLRHLSPKNATEADAKPSASELAAADQAAATSTPTPAAAEKKELTLEERALQALIAGEEEAKPAVDESMVIGLNSNTWQAQSEADALARDLDALPAEATLDDYAAVPVEAFGAAILRGMGYDASHDTAIHVPKSRPALLGLGAKALSSELPPSSHGKKKKRQDPATRGGRGFNAANLLVAKSAEGTPAPSSHGSRAGSPERRRIEDGDRRRERDDRDRRYETEEERARRKARERERDRDRDRDYDRRDRDRRDRDRDDRRDRDRDRDRRDRDRRDDRRDERKDDRRDRDHERGERERHRDDRERERRSERPDRRERR